MISAEAYSYKSFCDLAEIVQVFQLHEDLAGREVFSIDRRLSQDNVNFFAPRTERGYILRVLRLRNFNNPQKGEYRMPYCIWTPWGELRQEARDDLDWQAVLPPIFRELDVASIRAVYDKFSGFDGWKHGITQVSGRELPPPKLIKYWHLQIMSDFKQDDLSCKKANSDANMYEFLEDLRRKKNQEHTELRELWNKNCTQWLAENGYAKKRV